MIKVNLLPETCYWRHRGGYAVYRLTSPSGKIYVGYTQHTPKRRFKQHRRDAVRGRVGGCQALLDAMRKHGPTSFVLDVLQDQIPTVREAKDIETQWIARLRSNERSIGYNLTEGGEGRVPIFCKQGTHRFDEVGHAPTGGCAGCYAEYLLELKERRRTDPEWRAQQNRASNARYHRRQAAGTNLVQRDPQRREELRAYNRAYLAEKRKDPAWAEKERQRCREKDRKRAAAKKLLKSGI